MKSTDIFNEELALNYYKPILFGLFLAAFGFTCGLESFKSFSHAFKEFFSEYIKLLPSNITFRTSILNTLIAFLAISLVAYIIFFVRTVSRIGLLLGCMHIFFLMIFSGICTQAYYIGSGIKGLTLAVMLFSLPNFLMSFALAFIYFPSVKFGDPKYNACQKQGIQLGAILIISSFLLQFITVSILSAIML